MVRVVEKPRVVDEVMDKAKPWQLTEILDSVQCRLVTMPDTTDTSSKVCLVSRDYEAKKNLFACSVLKY